MSGALDARQTARLQALAIEAATNAIIIVDAQAPDRPIVHVNPAFETMTGYSFGEILGRNCRFLQGEDRDQPEVHRLRRAIAAGENNAVLLRNYRKDGTLFWNNLRVSAVRDESGAVTHFVGIQTDVTELKNYEKELEHRANHDTLTGLANRNLLNDRIAHAIATVGRSKRTFALVYLDLDRLKIVNDSLGHTNGDMLLQEIARRLTECVRDSDTVARLGGDEFAAVLHDMERPACVHIVTRMLRRIEEPVEIAGHELFISASIGVCIYPQDGRDGETLLQNADKAMYRAKSGGGNEMWFYTEDLNADAVRRLRMDGDLRRALAGEEFELHYQPRSDLDTGRVHSVEALIRWRHAGELISPAQFIPLAEETGVIVPIGLWVLRTACAQMRRWLETGCGLTRVAVNLSARQFRQADLLETIKSALADTGLDAHHLELEITESVAMHDPETTRATMQELKRLGIALAIDDFGTGYSSLAYLKRFPIDYLKIDQSFVRGLPNDSDDEHIVRAIIALGRNLNLTLIAEGVETEAQRDFLAAAGCHQAQGYLFCRPKPAAELAGILGPT